MSPDLIKLAEIRNNIKIRILQIQNNTAPEHYFLFSVIDISVIRICFEFRISDLPIGLRQVKLLNNPAPLSAIRDSLLKEMGSLYLS
jgi:hypothetical protein